MLSFVDLSAGVSQLLVARFHLYPREQSLTIEFFHLLILLLKLLNLTDRIQNLLVITKLLTVFDAYDNEPEALKSFE